MGRGDLRASGLLDAGSCESSTFPSPAADAGRRGRPVFRSIFGSGVPEKLRANSRLFRPPFRRTGSLPAARYCRPACAFPDVAGAPAAHRGLGARPRAGSWPQLQRAGLCPTSSGSRPGRVRGRAGDGPWDAVLSDFNLPGFTGPRRCSCCASGHALPFVLVSGEIGEDTGGGYAQRRQRLPAEEQPGALAPRSNTPSTPPRRTPRHARPTANWWPRASAWRNWRAPADQREEERAAIAREIHDDVGGSLTALKFDID